MGAAIGCDVNSVLERQSEARRIAADLLVQFTKAADAANRSVMADTDESSVVFAGEAEQAKEAIQKDAAALAPILQSLDYAEEARLLEEFGSRFTEYRELDRTILELAVENTNLKAQRLSFGPAQEAADEFRDALDAGGAPDAARDAWHVKALVATAVAAVREIQVLHAPHIADADDAVMTRMEKSMEASEASARGAAHRSPPLVDLGPARGSPPPPPPSTDSDSQRPDRRPISPQHQRAFLSAVLEPESAGHVWLRREPALAPGGLGEAWLHGHALADPPWSRPWVTVSHDRQVARRLDPRLMEPGPRLGARREACAGVRARR